jgi:nucleoside phosphorylase
LLVSNCRFLTENHGKSDPMSAHMRTSDDTRSLPCIVFPMGIEAYRFLGKLEVRRRWSRGKAVFREAFFEGNLLTVVRCGVGPLRAAGAIRNLGSRPGAIICAGAAGGLSSSMRIGDAIISSESLYPHELDSILPSHDALVQILASVCRNHGLRHSVARSVTVRDAVFPKKDRENLHILTSAVAVDMESHAICIEAAQLGVPFASVRVITDDMETPAPPGLEEVKAIWKTPFQLHKKLPLYFRRRAFMRDFDRSLDALHEILVGALRMGIHEVCGNRRR